MQKSSRRFLFFPIPSTLRIFFLYLGRALQSLSKVYTVSLVSLFGRILIISSKIRAYFLIFQRLKPCFVITVAHILCRRHGPRCFRKNYKIGFPVKIILLTNNYERVFCRNHFFFLFLPFFLFISAIFLEY